MATIFERVTTALSSISPAVAFSYAPYKGTLPDTFVTYQLLNGLPLQSADNVETERVYKVQISLWAKGGISSLPSVKAAMLSAGFRLGAETQLDQDQATGHYGIAQDYICLE